MSLDPSTLDVTLSESTNVLDMNVSSGIYIDPITNVLLYGMLTRTLTNLTDEMFPVGITSIYAYHFRYNENLTRVSLADITEIGVGAFLDCSITSLYMPNLVSAGNTAFSGNPLVEVELPSLQEISNSLFARCTNLRSARFDVAESVGTFAFSGCTDLEQLILASPTAVECRNPNALSSTAIADGNGAIYVPGNLITEYQSAYGWSEYADSFRSINSL